jgi:Bor protein
MSRSRALLLGLVMMQVAGCYAAKVETGLPASTTKIEQKWASGWIYGLVPPKTVATQAQCPNGVSVVETQLSFLNQVVSLVTLGIYTPMQIVVTCAEKSTVGYMRPHESLYIPENASVEQIQQIYAQAADAAVKSGSPVFVWRLDTAAQ